MTQDPTAADASADPGMDLSQFYQIFFEEAAENLERMEQLLLGIDLDTVDDETLNAIFRCAHSVKGGAATFGFSAMAGLTHEMETLLDRLRRHELAPDASMVDALLKSGDALRIHLAHHQAGGTQSTYDDSALVSALRGLAGMPTEQTRTLELVVGPLDAPEQADDLAELFREIDDLGTIERIDDGQTADGLRRFRIVTRSTDDDLLDLFTFHVDRARLRLQAASSAPSPGASSPAAGPTPLPDASKPPVESARGNADASTLRVSVEKVDQLINLVGELVITQAVLAQRSAHIDPQLYGQLASGLADLDRHTRSLQESVMSIRMIPMSNVFNRFPRMLRDLAARLGKQVDFVTHGEATELDKGLVEKIVDPLTHLVRNSCDHGIELPAERLAAGKPAAGTISLSAVHQGGSIVIEVRDDGRGLSREKLLAKARERRIPIEETAPDTEVWNLVFAPGFSTADAVSDVSGRGVGMDVVKRNIASLNGTVEIDSCAGRGMSVRVRLPLTLAIMDGMSVAVGDERYIVPLASVVESLQLHEGMARSMGSATRVVQVRDEYLPVVELKRIFEVPSRADAADPIMVIVESEGSRAALVVDALVGQQQVVVKNLEANYRKVDGISGATILGDGRVALILDVGEIARRAGAVRPRPASVH